jgi:4-amino-4-deoxy-L-arabinose transferase-like glycosyltransferase
LIPKKHNHPLYNWLFAGVVICFALFKFNDLFLPYFWDELGVYSQCAVYQVHHGISLLPASLPPELSRGHPLLFTFLNALVMKFLGTGVWVGHSFELLVSILLLCAVYYYAGRYFNRLTALVSVVLLVSQPLFLAQSALIVPEVMLALFLFLGLASYYEGKYFLFGVYASLAMLTKESAIVLPTAVMGYSIIQYLLFRNRQEAFKLSSLIFTFLPYLTFGVFLLVQKQQNGWYFFPYHVEGMSFDLNQIRDKFLHFFNFITWAQGRYWWMKFFLIAAAIGLLTNKISRAGLRDNFLLLLGVFATGFLLFSSLNYYMERYVTVLLVVAAIITGVSITTIFYNKWLCLVATLFLVVVALLHFEEHTFNNDFDMGYRRQLNSIKLAVDYIENLPEKNKCVYGNFPVYSAVNFPESGYLHNPSSIVPMMNQYARDAYFYIRSEPYGTDPDEGRFTTTKMATFEDGYARTIVYRLQKK